MRDGANTQYVTGTAMLFDIYGDLLARNNEKVVCGGKQFDSTRLQAFANQQVLENSIKYAQGKRVPIIDFF